MKKCFQAKGVCTITAHTPLSATLVWQLSHYLFRETCFMNSYPRGAFLCAKQRAEGGYGGAGGEVDGEVDEMGALVITEHVRADHAFELGVKVGKEI